MLSFWTGRPARPLGSVCVFRAGEPGFATLEEIAAVPDLGLLDIRHFGPKTRLVVDAALAAYRLMDDPAIRAAQDRRRHHINSRLSAAHRARNAALLNLLASCDLEIDAVDTILESLAAKVVLPADPRVHRPQRDPPRTRGRIGESGRPSGAGAPAADAGHRWFR